jgi:hypothetical protein
MTFEDKNNTLLQLQCKHGQFGINLAKALSVGNCSQELLNSNKFIAFNIDVLRRFKPFNSEVFNAAKLFFGKEYENQTVTVEVIVNGITLVTYTGSGSSVHIFNYLQNVINNSTNIHNYLAVSANGYLYIYTYDNSQDFNSLIELVVTNEDSEELHSEVTSLKNNLDELLNSWNCITVEDFNSISNCILKCYKINTLTNIV